MAVNMHLLNARGRSAQCRSCEKLMEPQHVSAAVSALHLDAPRRPFVLRMPETSFDVHSHPFNQKSTSTLLPLQRGRELTSSHSDSEFLPKHLDPDLHSPGYPSPEPLLSRVFQSQQTALSSWLLLQCIQMRSRMRPPHPFSLVT